MVQSKWELQYQAEDTTTLKVVPLQDYPEWELVQSLNMPVQKVSGTASVSFQNTSGKLSRLLVVRKVPEQAEA